MYAIKDEAGKITGSTKWPNHQTSDKVDQESQEWLDFLASEDEAGRSSESGDSTLDVVIDVLLSKGLITEAQLTQKEQEGLAIRTAKRNFD